MIFFFYKFCIIHLFFQISYHKMKLKLKVEQKTYLIVFLFKSKCIKL